MFAVFIKATSFRKRLELMTSYQHFYHRYFTDSSNMLSITSPIIQLKIVLHIFIFVHLKNT